MFSANQKRNRRGFFAGWMNSVHLSVIFFLVFVLLWVPWDFLPWTSPQYLGLVKALPFTPMRDPNTCPMPPDAVRLFQNLVAAQRFRVVLPRCGCSMTWWTTKNHMQFLSSPSSPCCCFVDSTIPPASPDWRPQRGQQKKKGFLNWRWLGIAPSHALLSPKHPAPSRAQFGESVLLFILTCGVDQRPPPPPP